MIVAGGGEGPAVGRKGNKVHRTIVTETLPTSTGSTHWHTVIDTQYDSGFAPVARYEAGQVYPLQERSVALLMQFRMQQ